MAVTMNGIGDNHTRRNLPVLDVEILQNASSSRHLEDVQYLAYNFLKNKNLSYSTVNYFTDFQDKQLQDHMKELRICDDNKEECQGDRKDLLISDILHKYHINYHIYKLNSDCPGDEDFENDIPAATHWVLPSTDFHGLWESLVYDTPIKNHLMKFVITTNLFSDRHVDSNIISWNRVVLLHGPPGTGKTSLCKALAQKLSIRLLHRYTHGQLIEINSHSLFSKWFSESGKLVMKMFQKIQELIDDPQALVFVLIDEVESLAHARNASMGGTEPSDAIRVVNALLTQIDKIRRYPNVIILTTSNMTEAIDLAFVDRADIKYYVGLPSAEAIYHILYSCVEELEEKGIIYPKRQLYSWNEMRSKNLQCEYLGASLQLQEIARFCQGLSGRTLKKLPFLAHALFINFQSPTCDMETFLVALKKAAEQQFKEIESLRLSSAKSSKKNTYDI